MATTSPDNLRTPDPGDSYNLVPDLATLANDVQSALTLRDPEFFTGTSSDRTTFTSTATNGMLWQDTDSIKMIWRKDGAGWVPAVWRWSGTTAQRNSFLQAPDGFEWQDTNGDMREWVRKAGDWRGRTPLSGSAVLSAPSGGGVVTHPITFPAGYFETPPSVMVNPQSAVGPTTEVRANSMNVTTSGADIILARSSAAATPVDWVAIPV